MKKSKLYRSVAAAAMAVLFLGAFASCEKYDDTELRNSINGLNSTVDDLDDRLTDLEKAVASLQSEVDAINNLLSGSKIISSITPNADGTQYTISYVAVNGAAPASDVITVGTGDPLVTVIEEGGVKYWAVVTENGPQAITVGGNKIPVKPAEVEIPEQKAPVFKIEEETGKLLVSIDNGTQWTETGISVSDIYTPEEPVVPIVSDVEIGDSKVTFTLNSGLTFDVPMTSELSCDIVDGKTMFSAGETKILTVKASGYTKHVLTAPFGWSAVFNGVSISVTAPAEGATAAASGEIVLQVFGNGKVEMDKVAVGVGTSAFTVTTAKTEDGDINITVDYSMGSSIFLGAMKVSEYSAEAAAALANAELNGAATNYQKRLPLNYETWEYDAYETLFSELYENPTPDSYVLWMADPYAESITPDIIETYMLDWGRTVTVEATDITFQDATVTITPAANTEYYYGVMESSNYNPEYPSSILYQLNRLTATSETISSTLSQLGASMYLEPEAGTSYTVWTVVKSTNPAYEYTAADIQIYQFSLAGYAAGGSLSLTFGDVVATATSIAVPITVPEGAVKMYIQYLPDSEYGEYTEEQIIEYLLSSNPMYLEMTEFSRNLDPETKGRVCALIIDGNGQYGSLAKIQADCSAIPRNNSIGVSAGEPVLTSASATVPLIFTGEPVKFVYYMQTKSTFESAYDGNAAAVNSAIANNPSRYGFTTVNVSELTDGNLSLTGLNFATDYVLIGAAFDADNVASETYVSIEFSTPAPTVISADDPTYEAMFPDLSTVTTADNYIRGTIEPKEGTTVYYCVRAVTAALEGEGIELITNMMAAYPTSSSTTLNLYRSFWSDSYMYVTCVDAAGNWYEPKIITCTYVSAQ